MRKTKPAVVWLPSDGGNSIGSANVIPKVVIVSVDGPAGNTASGGIPLVPDEPSTLAADRSLSDYEGSAYRLRRIVGKIWVGVEQDPEPPGGTPDVVLCTAGFIILRVDDNGNPLQGAATPIYNPQIINSERDPWIWRRSWMLRNKLVAPGGIGNQAEYPITNADYGSVMDGPHVDAKTARSVKDEERLFVIVATMAVNGSQGSTVNTRWFMDLRVLATMYKSSGNRRNASR